MSHLQLQCSSPGEHLMSLRSLTCPECSDNGLGLLQGSHLDIFDKLWIVVDPPFNDRWQGAAVDVRLIKAATYKRENTVSV